MHNAGKRILVYGLICAGAVISCASAAVAASSAPRRGADVTHFQAPLSLGVSLANPGNPAELQGYVAKATRAPKLIMWFQGWTGPLFWQSQLDAVESVGAVPMITWEPWASPGVGIPLRDIVAGDYDGYIRTSADQARNYGKPLLIRFAHEMNLPGSAWGVSVNGNTPAGYIAAWRHVVSIFRLAGATNVRWVWSPNIDCDGTCPFAAFFPGDAWVDWVGLDGYNYGTLPYGRWRSLAEAFGGSYDKLAALSSRPMMIAETASTELGGSKAQWITQSLMRDIPNRLPRVKAVVWFQRVRETDWRINSSLAALAAYRAVAQSALYSGAFAP